ncbi:hypothetical protein Tco_0850026 [Tanacetum coccineum]
MSSVPNVPKAPKTPSHTKKKVPQCKRLGAKTGLRRKHTSESNTKASNSQAGHLEKENMSSTTMDSNPSEPSASTPVDAELNKEDQQAAGGPTSLGVTTSFTFHSESASGYDASANFTAEVDPEISASHGTNPSVLVDTTKFARDGSQTAHIVSGTKQNTRSAFISDEYQEDEPFIISKKSSEEHDERNEDTHLEQEKEKADAEIAILKAHSIPTELKELPTKITKLHEEVNELKKHIQEFKIELRGEFNEIPEKLETFSSTVSSLTTQIKTPDAVLGLLNKVTNTLNRFAIILRTPNECVPSAGKSTVSHAEREKNTNPIKDDETSNLVDLMGIDVVEEYHKKKLLYDKMDKLTQTEQELKIDFNKPLKEQDPLNELNELANEERKRAGDFSDAPRSSAHRRVLWFTRVQSLLLYPFRFCVGLDRKQTLEIVTTSRYVVPTGRVKVPAGRYVVPTGKDKFIVSAGRTKVIPAGSTILVLVVLCLLRVDSKS